jgi:hypothetical protein
MCSRVKSVYVGKGEIAHLISQFQASSTVVERLTGANKLNESTKTEAALDLATQLIQLPASAALLSAGFHTHKGQRRRKRHCFTFSETGIPVRSFELVETAKLVA